jgi:hypothetical protein
MENFNFSEVEVNEQVSKPRIKGFTIQEVMITGVVDSVAKSGGSQIEVGFINDAGEEHTERMSLSGGAKKYTMIKLKHMMTKVSNEDTVNQVKNTDDINKILSGKRMRIKFTAEEFMDKNNNIRTKASIGLPSFAESIIEGKATELSLDKDNKFDYKKYEKAPDLITGQSNFMTMPGEESNIEF